MVKVIEGDMFESDAIYICHQVNCQGEMRTGVAQQVRQKYPEAYQMYKQRCDSLKDNKESMLGYAQFVPSRNGKTIVNMFSQNNYGYDGEVYIDYRAFKGCLLTIKRHVPKNKTIAMPYLIGCHRGGGEWGIVLPMIEEVLSDHNVELWRYDGG